MKSKASKYLLIINVINIFIALVFVSYRYEDVIQAKMGEWKLNPKQERFTELYFVDHANLPKRLKKGEKISFSFVVHNLEGKSMDYPYAVIFLSQDGQTAYIEERSVTLSDGEYKSIQKSFTPTLQENKGEIFIELQNLQQGIHFALASES